MLMLAAVCGILAGCAGLLLSGEGKDTKHFANITGLEPDLSMANAESADDNFSYDVSTAGHGYIVTDTSTGGYAVTVSYADGTENYVYLDLPKGKNVIPLAAGEGEYLVSIAAWEGGDWYSYIVQDMPVSVCGADCGDILLLSDYMVNYSLTDPFIGLAGDLMKDCSTEREAVEAVCKWVYSNISYDTKRREKIRRDHTTLSKNIPDLCKVYEERCGICMDKASLAAAMLRSRRIPVRLCFGSHKDEYHAWLEFRNEGSWEVADPTFDYMGAGNDYDPVYYY